MRVAYFFRYVNVVVNFVNNKYNMQETCSNDNNNSQQPRQQQRRPATTITKSRGESKIFLKTGEKKL